MKTKLALAGLISLSCATHALAGTHYVPGIEGIKASSVPPPGVYYKAYLINYDADKFKDGPPKSEATVNALAHRFIWVTEQEFLGGNLGFEAILPMISQDVQVGGNKVVDDSGLGDLFVGSFIGWHGDSWDAIGGLGYWADTGSDDIGEGHGSVMLTLGGTLKLNQEGDLTLSALTRYEIANKSGVGDELILEWGLGKSFGTLDVGAVGYSTQGLGDNTRDRNAAGLSIGNFWPSLMLGADLAAYQEFGNKNWFEGRVIRASLTKVF